MTDAWDHEKAWATLKEVGAYLTGHFLLTTGRHSNQFFLMARLTERPALFNSWAQELARRLEPFGALTVVGPAVGGIVPAYAVASHWSHSRMLFAEKVEGGGMAFKRGFHIQPDEPVVVVEDAVTTGSSVKHVIDAVHHAGGQVRAVGTLVDRHQGDLAFSEPLVSLLRCLDVPNWEPSDCPLCQQGVALTRPKT